MEQYHGTTIVSVRRGNQVALGGDGFTAGLLNRSALVRTPSAIAITPDGSLVVRGMPQVIDCLNLWSLLS